MGFIEAPFGDTPEEVRAPEGMYDLRIFNKETGLKSKPSEHSEGGRDMVRCDIAIEDNSGTDYAPMSHWLVFPLGDPRAGTGDWEQNANGQVPAKQMIRGIKRFLAVFGIEFGATGFEEEDLDGAVGRCLIRQQTGDDDEIYNRLRLPRLKE
jgi:hypothetical protein